MLNTTPPTIGNCRTHSYILTVRVKVRLRQSRGHTGASEHSGTAPSCSGDAIGRTLCSHPKRHRQQHQRTPHFPLEQLGQQQRFLWPLWRQGGRRAVLIFTPAVRLQERGWVGGCCTLFLPSHTQSSSIWCWSVPQSSKSSC